MAAERTGTEKMAEMKESLLAFIDSSKDIAPHGRQVLALLVANLWDAHETVRTGNMKHEATGSVLLELAAICRVVPARLGEIERRLDAIERK